MTILLKNIRSLGIDKAYRLVGGLFVGALTARYLQPESYGLLSYATATVATLMGLSSFGINPYIVGELSADRREPAEFLKNSFSFKVVTSILAYTVLATFVVIQQTTLTEKLLLLFAGCSLLLNPFTVSECYLKSQMQGGIIARSGILGFTVNAVYRLACVALQAPLVAFSLATPINDMTVSLRNLFVIVKRFPDILKKK